MKQIIESSKYDFFREVENFDCGHRIWDILKNKDEKTEPKEETTKLHECSKIRVWQKKGGLKRYFVKLEGS